MKYLISLLSLAIAFAPSAFAAESNNPLVPVSFVLLKCNAAKIGTLWTSFGHARLSGSDEIKIFPTEIGFFDVSNKSSRKVYFDFKEALQIPLVAEAARIHFEFTTEIDGVVKSNVLTVSAFDKHDPNSYTGNWQVSTPGQSDFSDLALCTVY
jgi:hypothetical protein